MQSLRNVARALAWLAGPARRRGGPRLAPLMAMAAVSFAAVLAGSAMVPVLMAGTAVRPPTALAPFLADRGSGAASAPLGAPGAPSDRGFQAASAPAGAPGAPPADVPGGDMSSPDVRVILPSRLGEIFQARERAYAQRDETVLDTIYTADCTCLRSGRAAIARLLADHVVWRGRSVSLRVERLSRVDDSLWIALVVLRRGVFRIEREDGALISAVRAVRQRYRFALVRVGGGAWLLGHASLIEELPA